MITPFEEKKKMNSKPVLSYVNARLQEYDEFFSCHGCCHEGCIFLRKKKLMIDFTYDPKYLKEPLMKINKSTFIIT